MTNRVSKAAAGVFVAGALLVTPFLAATSAQAAPLNPDPLPVALVAPALGVETSGMAVVLGNEVAPLATENVGGGTWTHGASTNSQGTKHCYSYYIHHQHQHTATAILGSNVQKASAKPGVWANANAYGGPVQTCYTYWNVI